MNELNSKRRRPFLLLRKGRPIVRAAIFWCFLVLETLVQAEKPLPAQEPVVALFGETAASEQVSKLLRHEGYSIRRLTEGDLSEIDVVSPDLLIVAPKARVPPGSREAVHRFRLQGGPVVVMDPMAFHYPNGLTEPVQVVDLSDRSAFTVREIPVQSREPVVEILPERTASGSGNAVRVTTHLVGDGDVLVEIPLGQVRSSRRSVVGFEARGGPGVGILYLSIQDRQGESWISFVEVGSAWKAHEVGLEDFLPQNPDANESEYLVPEEIETLRIGMVSRVLWPEQGGSFSLANLVLGEGSRSEPIRTAAVAPWRVQYNALKVPFPDWVWDPFWNTREMGENIAVESVQFGGGKTVDEARGRVWEVPKPPHQRGREHAPASTRLDPGDLQYRSLATTSHAGERGAVIAEWRHHNDGPFAGTSLLLIGAPEEDYSTGSPWGEVLRFGVGRIFSATIDRATPVLLRWEGDGTPLVARVAVSNPSRERIDGRVSVDVGAGSVTGEAAVSIGAGEEATVDVVLSEVPVDFNWSRFERRVELLVDNRAVDTLTDIVDLGSMLLEAARYLVRVQDHHGDGRFSHHFFSDQYAARFLFGFARFLQRTKGGESLGLRIDRDEVEAFQASAFRFGDMIVRRQESDGSFPMGYFEHRDFAYVADLGQVCLGMVQMASWMHEEDPRRERYLKTVRKYLEFRQSFHMTPERVEKLESEYGPQKGIQEGAYGLGLLDIDYFDGSKWGELRREERGPWWVLPVSMAFLGGLAQIENEPDVREIARNDIGVYFDSGFEISQAAHFHAESLFWMPYGVTDPEMRGRIARKLNEELPARIFCNIEYPYFAYQGRAALWPLSATYAQRYLERRPSWRAALLAGILSAGCDSSSNSLRNITGLYPITTYGPSLGAYRYAAFSAIWMLELVDEGSSLFRDTPLPLGLDKARQN